MWTMYICVGPCITRVQRTLVSMDPGSPFSVSHDSPRLESCWAGLGSSSVVHRASVQEPQYGKKSWPLATVFRGSIRTATGKGRARRTRTPGPPKVTLERGLEEAQESRVRLKGRALGCQEGQPPWALLRFLGPHLHPRSPESLLGQNQFTLPSPPGHRACPL